MPSFDVVSEADAHEVTNAFDQAKREIAQRFDFRGTDTDLTRTKDGFEIKAKTEDRVVSAIDVLKDKFVKRKLSLKFLDVKEILPAGLGNYRVEVPLKKGVGKDDSKKIIALIKDQPKLKVTTAIQGEVVRVTAKKIDDLQDVIAMLRAAELPIALGYQNFRD